MATLVTKTFGPGKDFTTWSSLVSYLSSLDCVATDTYTVVDCYADLVGQAGDVSVSTCSDTQRVLIRPAAGLGVNALNTATFNLGSSGLQFYWNGYAGITLHPGIDIAGFIIKPNQFGALITQYSSSAVNTYDNIFRFNRFDCSQNYVTIGASGNRTSFVDNLFTSPTNNSPLQINTIANVDRNTFVATGSGVNASRAVNNNTGAMQSIRNSVFINYGTTVADNNTAFVNSYSNTQPTGGGTTGLTVNTATGALVVNETSDYRPASGGGLIGKATADAKATQDILGNNRGSNPDVGAWQLNPAAALPTATVTSTSVSGTSVTISGTTTNTPTSGAASIAPTNVQYNDGVAQGPINVTLGNNTFTVTFSNVHVGRYTPTLTFTNSGGTVSATNTTNFDIVGATGTVTSQSLDGQTLTISGTTTGSPTSGSYTVPAAASNPNGAVTAGPSAVTLGTNTFTFSQVLQPGNYDASVIRLATANGTSFPLSGTNPVSVVAISGNPQAPGNSSNDTTAPVMTGSLTNSNILTTGYTLNWPAATDNVAVTGYEVSTDGGTTYTDVGNVLTRVITGKSQNTTYNNRVRAYDASGNRATPLSNTATTQTASDMTAPVMQGSLTSSNVTQTGYTLTWQAATDDTGVTGYEVSTDAGTTYTDVGNVLTRAVSGKTASTTYGNRVRAYDAAGNRASPLSNSVTTASPGTSTASTSVILTVAIGAQYRANLQGMQWYWYDKLSPFGTPVDQGDASAINALGQLAINMPDSSKGSGDLGWLVVTDLDDRTGIPFKVFSGVVRIN